jgi:hypothetical protein
VRDRGGQRRLTRDRETVAAPSRRQVEEGGGAAERAWWLGRAGEEQRGGGGEAFARVRRGVAGDQRIFMYGAHAR